jgi:hypothetical protein
MKKIQWAIALLAAFFAFTMFMSMVGNPHVVETILGVIIAVVVGFYVFRTCGGLSKYVRESLKKMVNK